jgi:hypothetical protein
VTQVTRVQAIRHYSVDAVREFLLLLQKSAPIPPKTGVDRCQRWGKELNEFICHRHLKIEELFAEEALAEIKI